MRITSIYDSVESIASDIQNAYINFSKMTCSVVAVVTDQIIDGKPVGQSIIQGEGAGPAATTSALVSDISSILRGNVKFPF